MVTLRSLRRHASLPLLLAMRPVKNVDLVYFDAGGGHRATALALQEGIAARHHPWRTRLVDLFELLDPDRRIERWLGAGPAALYNRRVAAGWTFTLPLELKLLHAMIRLTSAPMQRRLAQHWARTQPDLVVSVVPNFNRVLCQGLKTVLPQVPFVTLMTDLADVPPHFWIEPDLPQHIICGSEHAVRQARAAGQAPDLVHRTSGMVIREAFYRNVHSASATAPAAQRDRAAQRTALGLPVQHPCGLVMFGGGGGAEMLAIARALHDQPLLLLCGHDAALARALRKSHAIARHVVVEFTREVPQYMALADYFIGKPGPGCLSEALHTGLPVITVCNASTLPQERYNAQWVRSAGLGLALPNWPGIGAAVQLMHSQLGDFQQRVNGLDNRAVIEVPELLAQIAEAPPRRDPVPSPHAAPRGASPAHPTGTRRQAWARATWQREATTPRPCAEPTVAPRRP